MEMVDGKVSNEHVWVENDIWIDEGHHKNIKKHATGQDKEPLNEVYHIGVKDQTTHQIKG